MTRKLKTMDGNTAAAHVSYAFTEVAATGVSQSLNPIRMQGETHDITTTSAGDHNCREQIDE